METETLEDLRAAFADNPRMLAWLDGEGDGRAAAEADVRHDIASFMRAERARAAARMKIKYDMRRLANFVKLWDSCGRDVCRKARACRTRKVTCFDRLAETIVERLEATLEWWRLTEGPPDEELLDREVAHLRHLGAPL